ncbi:hypothetical protein B0H16DRAFT_1530296 [Mycena metata]|uniref:Uncharacterized protein n=1 Tax=Mycena metata TaxID=1033252 RepID=A0AAD7JCQ3_9AGAR|nr:hypothetical protein B0H16DRAFT_1530296 [Mycena metata]
MGIASYYAERVQDMPTALKHCEVSRSLAQSSGNYERQAEAVVRFAHIKWSVGEYTIGQAYAKEAQRLAKISGYLDRESRGLYYEALCLQALGNYRDCISLTIRARALLDLCGMSHGDISYVIMNCQAEVHKVKSEYEEALAIQNEVLKAALSAHHPYQHAVALANTAELEVLMGVASDVIQKKIDTSRAVFQRPGHPALLVSACDWIQADLNLREGDGSSVLLCRCLREVQQKDTEIAGHCLERLADTTRWGGLDHPSSWSIIFLVHSLKTKRKLDIYKSLQFIGDIFLKENDEVTALNLFMLALEGFISMDVHQSRAECILRIGDMSKRNGYLLKAFELWEAARPLFERSLQAVRVQDIDERLAAISNDVKEQYRNNLAQLATLNAPVGKVQIDGHNVASEEEALLV